jgi:hypothetical protein
LRKKSKPSSQPWRPRSDPPRFRHSPPSRICRRLVRREGNAMNCPKCDADIGDIGDSYEPDDRSGGICGGWYCDACELALREHEVPREPVAVMGDVETMSAREFRRLELRSPNYRHSPAQRTILFWVRRTLCRLTAQSQNPPRLRRLSRRTNGRN